MARPLPTTKAQVSGHKFLRRRVEHGYLDEYTTDLDTAVARVLAPKAKARVAEEVRTRRAGARACSVKEAP